jgi:hypothetical protein
VPLDAIAPMLRPVEALAIPELADVEEWIAMQAPKLREAWERLKNPPSASFDASKADFAIACCLSELGRDPSDVARILLQLPGSRARERGESYALVTATRARMARSQRRGGSEDARPRRA